jgi:glutathione S-transferase
MLKVSSCLLSDNLCLADISIGTCLYRYFNLDIERPTLVNLERYYAALSERPAYQQHVMMPFGGLFGRLDF